MPIASVPASRARPSSCPSCRSSFLSATWVKLLSVVLVSLGLAFGPAAPAQAEDRVLFGTNWRAQGGHGGFYQALADGTYKRHGLDVTIVQGGPQVNNRPLLAAGKLDFLLAGNLIHSFDNVKNGLPTVAVAAFFQRDPQILMTHQGAYRDFEDLRNARTVLIGKDGQFSFWQWLKQAHGFRDEQLRPYAFSLGPFLHDPKLVQQGYASSEPYSARGQGITPDVYLLADHGWSTYSTTIETRSKLARSNPDLVQRFVDASIIGWVNFLYGDHQPAYKLIREANPEMTDELLDFEIKVFKESGIVDSGDSLSKGIGAIDLERVKAFYALMVKAGLYKAGELDPLAAVSAQFVNKGVGLDVRKRLAP